MMRIDRRRALQLGAGALALGLPDSSPARAAVPAGGRPDLSGVTLRAAHYTGGDISKMMAAAGVLDTPYRVQFSTFASGNLLAETFGGEKTIILRNHGLLTVGLTVEAAAWWFISMDNAARTQLLAEAAGMPKPIAHGIAARTARQVGTHRGGYFSFQPLWDSITATDPDLFD